MTLPSSSLVGIALGSNLGVRASILEDGFAFLRGMSCGDHFLRSSVLETLPVDCPEGSPSFLNAVAEIEVRESPWELLKKLQAFERSLGRPLPADRPVNAPRSLDLDILYFGARIINEPDLVIPHPRLTQRQFVLAPLAEIRPQLILPGQSLTVLGLWYEWQSEHN